MLQLQGGSTKVAPMIALVLFDQVASCSVKAPPLSASVSLANL
jgi:hypothetical protein